MDDDINFTYETNTEVYSSCAATLDGEMFVLGGENQKRQVNIINLQKPGHMLVIIITELNKMNHLDKQSWRL